MKFITVFRNPLHTNNWESLVVTTRDEKENLDIVEDREILSPTKMKEFLANKNIKSAKLYFNSFHIYQNLDLKISEIIYDNNVQITSVIPEERLEWLIDQTIDTFLGGQGSYLTLTVGE